VLNRAIWRLVVADTAAVDPLNPPIPIALHARNHPLEVQSSWVMREAVRTLLGADAQGDPTAPDSLARELLQRFTFTLIPMANPDGVEDRGISCAAGAGRCNAHGVDIEANWSAASPEPEVVAIRDAYAELLTQTPAVQLALNLHSAFECNRFFWYHAEGGTSALYAQREQAYIGDVRQRFSAAAGAIGLADSIQSWSSHVSWTSAFSPVYPEGWWWNNAGADVLALTYEERKECSNEGSWDLAARALLGGALSYFFPMEFPVAVADDPRGLGRGGTFGDAFGGLAPARLTWMDPTHAELGLSRPSRGLLEQLDLQGHLLGSAPLQCEGTCTIPLTPADRGTLLRWRGADGAKAITLLR